jgi:hypothetical protein
MAGTYPFRCVHCNHRFQINIWLWSRLAFAKCPKCLRAELATWPGKNYRLPLWKNLLVTFGAHRYRCAACRCRFVSFRPLEKRAGQTTDAEQTTDSNPVTDEAVKEIELLPETESKP